MKHSRHVTQFRIGKTISKKITVLGAGASSVLETARDTKDVIKASAEITYTGAQIAYATADGAVTIAKYSSDIKDTIAVASDTKTMLSQLSRMWCDIFINITTSLLNSHRTFELCISCSG